VSAIAPLVGHGRRTWLYGAAVLVVLFLVLPVLIVVPMSFSGSRYLDFPPATWSWRWYERFLSSLDWYQSLLVSLRVAVVTALVATPIGVAAGYAIHSVNRPFFRWAQTVLMLPLMIPHIIVAIGVFYAYVQLSLVGSFLGLVLAHVMLAVPFVVVTTVAGLRTFDMSQELAARSLGCSRLRAFVSVTLPQISGSVLSGGLFAFVTSLDEVVVAMLVSAGDNTTITKVMFASLRDELDPTIAAVSSILIVGSLVAALLAFLFSWLGNYRR